MSLASPSRGECWCPEACGLLLVSVLLSSLGLPHFYKNLGNVIEVHPCIDYYVLRAHVIDGLQVGDVAELVVLLPIAYYVHLRVLRILLERFDKFLIVISYFSLLNNP